MHHEGGCIFTTFHLTFSKSLCLHLSHYSVPVASFTLQRNCYAVYLSRSDASANSFTRLSPLFLCILFLQAKKGKVLNSPHFLLCFFFFPSLLFFFSSHINFPQKACTSNLYAQDSPALSLLAVPSPLQFRLHWAHAQWILGRQSHQYTAGQRETHIIILALSCPYSSPREHDGVAEEERGFVPGGEVKRRGK